MHHAAERTEPIAFASMAPPDKPTPGSLHAEIEELFAELWQVPRFAGLRRGFRPNVDSYRTDDPHELTVVVEVPGIDPKSLTIGVDERMLVIGGERARDRSGGRVYQQMEIEYGLFQRQIRLSEDVDPERATATYEHGIVTITLPVAEKPKPVQRYAILVERA
jgi:HSP20 family protein